MSILRHPAPATQATRTPKKVLDTTDAELFSTIPIPVYGTVMLYGYQGFDAGGLPISNAGNVHVGWAEDELAIVIEPGELKGIAILSNTGGLQKDLSTLWVKGAIGDGVVAQFTS